MKRREFLSMSSSALAFLGSFGLGIPSVLTGKQKAFAADGLNTLLIPPLLENLDPTGKTARFKFTAKKGSRRFLGDKPTSTLGYNGDFLGPTIRVRNGQKFKLTFDNQLNETTTLHWHGLHVPAKWDGGPRSLIRAGERWEPEFDISQQAATLWYHPHVMGLTGKQVYKGLAGLFLIDDEFSDQLDLPREYGVDDIPLIIQDRQFYLNGEFAYDLSMHEIMSGVIGNRVLVNGAMNPLLTVSRNLIRFRVLNGSNSTIYRIGFGEKLPFHIIAGDGGFLARPVEVESVVLSAGERVELLVDFDKISGNKPSKLVVEQYGGTRFEAMTFIASQKSNTSSDIPTKLRPFKRIPLSDAERTRYFTMETMRGGMGMMGGGLTINGKKMRLNRIDERIKTGTTEIWEISNRSRMMMRVPHSMHIHDVQFQLIARNGKPPEPHEMGRKDTVLLLPGEVVRIIIKFGDYKGIYMYHCHLLEHEDEGMMGQFEMI